MSTYQSQGRCKLDFDFDKVVDSGERHQFPTGSQRDIRAGKGRFDLLPMYALLRLARHFENGAKKYGDDNWRKGQPLSVYLNSAMRHLAKFAAGMTDEDHLAAAAWNVLCLIETAKAIEEGILPAELDDLDFSLKPKEW